MTLLHLGGRWFAVDGAALRPLEDYPKVDMPVWVVEDFADAPAGAIRLQGKPAHAAALIERKVRADGLVDGESHVLIHRQRKVADGMQALYTAVPLAPWQKVMEWAAEQKSHCLILPLAALVAAGVGKGEARVVRHGRQVMYVADAADGFAYASVNAYSDAADDLVVAARSLGEQARGSLRGREQRRQVSWCPLLASPEEDAGLMRVFGEAAECTVETGQLAPLTIQGGRTVQSALPYLLKCCSVSMTVNPWHEKLAAAAEQALPLSTMAAAIVAAGLFILGAVLHSQAATEAANAYQLQRQAEQREQSSRALQQQAAPEEYAGVQTFVGTLSAQPGAYNPYRALSVLRQAAGADVRVLRVRMETAGDKQGGLVVDGALRDGVDPAALTRFLLRLRTAGYSVTPLDPADGGQGGSFTYRLASKEIAS